MATNGSFDGWRNHFQDDWVDPDSSNSSPPNDGGSPLPGDGNDVDTPSPGNFASESGGPGLFASLYGWGLAPANDSGVWLGDPGLLNQAPTPVSSASSAATPETPTNSESTNWSGGVITAAPGESFSTVSAQWVIPTIAQVPINGVTTSDIAEWVGIDGYQSSDVCQAGVYEEAQTSNGQTTLSCEAWVEWYPADAEFIPLSSFDVNPGNTISVTVETSGAGATEATFIFDDETTGQTYETTLTAPTGTSLQGNSAEAIVETPELISGNGQVSQPLLADFLNSPVTFDDVSATYSNGSAASLSSAQSIDLETKDVPGISGYVQEAYGSIQPASDSVTVTENQYWPTPPTTAEMIMTDTSGNYYIYDIGNNSLQGSNLLENLGTGYTFGGIGNFGGDSGDMMLRASNGDVYVYDISNNQITGTHDLGNVGTNWTIAGFGDFSGNPGETDMIMQQSSGNLEVYDISNNEVTFATSLGNFGSNTVAGFGDFSGNAGETDMMMRSSTGDLLVYDMGKNSVTSGPIDLGNVGLNWVVYGFGDFSSNANETDLIMRNTSNGDFELYDISDNRVVSAEALGNVGLEWTLAGFGDFSGNPGETDMLLRDSNNGDFEIYDFANNQIYNAASIGEVTQSYTVAGTGPDVSGSDTMLSTSLGAAVASASMSADGGMAGFEFTNAGQSPQSFGSTNGLSEIVAPMSSLFSAPAPMAEFSSTLSEPSTAATVLAADTLQHTV